MHHPPLPPGPGLSLRYSRAALPQADSTHRPACWASQESGTPRVPARPQVVQEVDEAALTRASRRCWSLLFLRRRREQRRSFPRWRAGRRIFYLILFLVPTFSKKEQFPFPPGSQVHGTTVCDALLPHSRPRPILPVAKKVRFGDDIPPHESWTGLCTSSRSRCWCTGGWSNAFSPRIGLQRSTWRMLTFTFRSFCDTDVSTVCVRRSGMAVQGPPLRALPVSPCVHEVVEGALTPLREVGVRILNYLDDWLILAQSREQLGDHRDLVLRHLSQLGLRVNWEKSKLSPVQRISFLGVELDSVSMTAHLMEERAQAVLNCLSSFKGRNVVPLKQFQRLLGHRASAAAVTPLGLLHMRPLQHWLHSRVPRWAWRRGTLRMGISQQCRCSLSPWTDLAFLRAGVPLEQVSRHTVVTIDASSTGWGATCNGQAASGSGQGPDCFGTSTAWSCGQCI